MLFACERWVRSNNKILPCVHVLRCDNNQEGWTHPGQLLSSNSQYQSHHPTSVRFASSENRPIDRKNAADTAFSSNALTSHVIVGLHP